jgi:hypothetical protein
MLLAFKFKMGVLGFWTGLLATTTTQALVQIFVISRFDWELEAERARALVGDGGGGDGAGTAADVEAGGGAEAAAAAGGGVKGDDECRPLLLDASRSLSSALLSEQGSFALPRGASGRLEPALSAARSGSSLELPRLRPEKPPGAAGAPGADAARDGAVRRDQAPGDGEAPAAAAAAALPLFSLDEAEEPGGGGGGLLASSPARLPSLL